jgi:hypothetical protein
MTSYQVTKERRIRATGATPSPTLHTYNADQKLSTICWLDGRRPRLPSWGLFLRRLAGWLVLRDQG